MEIEDGQRMPVGELVGTARSLALAAVAAGWSVQAGRVGDTVAIAAARAGGWRLEAHHTHGTEWDATLVRPGWPKSVTNVLELRRIFKAQTAALGAASTPKTAA